MQKITQAVSVLFVLLMSAMLVLPPGIDLELCFGKDGHIDFSLNGCREGVSVEEQSFIDNTARYGECFDVTVACSAAKEIIRTVNKTASDPFKLKKDHSNTPLLFQKSLADFAGAYLNEVFLD